MSPVLAEAVPTVENGLWVVMPDGQMKTTWKIKPAAVWQDGQPVTTQDLVFTMMVVQDPEIPIPRSPVLNAIDRVDTPDDSTVVVSWSRPFIEADQLFSEEIILPMPKHLHQKVYDEDKANFLGAPYWSQDFIGTGPYKVKDWALNIHVVVEANPRYVLGKPKIDEIEVKFIQDPSTLAANILAGVDVTLGRALSLDQALQIKDQWDGGFILRVRAWTPINVQFMNPNPQIITDLRFRQAMLQAIDREQLVDSIMAGQSTIAHTWVNPETSEFQDIKDSVVRWDFDPRRAGQTIESLGYRKGDGGFLFDGSGQKLTVELRTTVQNPTHVPTTAAVANTWEQLGVGVEQNLVSPQLAQDLEYRAQFPSFELVQTGNQLSSSTVRKYLSSSISSPDNRFTVGGNNSRYSNPEVDDAINRYISTIPRPGRMEALGKLVNIQSSQLSMLPLFYAPEPTMISRHLKNVAGRGDIASESWNAEIWDLAP